MSELIFLNKIFYEKLKETIKTMDMLMGKSESSSRRVWLEERGNEVEADI